ncbi:polyphosphate kinase [Haloarcula vallismortis]|uniref:Polyphosphate kinase n=2 Tax=Haloarcula vallismortis TaxID=28442 RepID=M0J8Y3_HALVA|nr:polyphosphate kinase 1 [Haloarcula vallismortis]EMA05557.1 polyphosphate kinase [Haloarcula vallismortis ATCC 29715]SDW85893.1 polyphosphate kinase [Haloarcula vallismortis]
MDLDSGSNLPAYEPADVDLTDSSLYLNRELSALAFQRRVLHEALDERNPLLERVRFLAIVTRNLDEFTMKRIGGLKQQIEADVTETAPDGRTPREQWEEVHETLRPMLATQARCYRDAIRPALAAEGVEILDYDDATETEQSELRTYFEGSVLPTLTPLSFDPAHPFPFISNRSLSLAVLTRQPDADDPTFTRIKIPPNRPRLVQLGDEARYVPLEEVIRANLDLLLPNVEIVDTALFRLTRNAEVRRNQEIAEDLIDMVEDVIEQRRFASVVRMEISEDADPRIRSTLATQLGLDEREIYDLPGPLDYRDFAELTDLERPDLSLDEWTPQPHPRLDSHRQQPRNPSESSSASVFSRIRDGDILLHHPYHDFTDTVQRFISEAAEDPDVLAVKAAIYRTASDSQIIQSLITAAENGKQVAVMVELKARFDEQNNLEWVRKLEENGIHVAYGTVGLKTHTKTALVVREEDDGVQLYSHIGTGNYHSETAKGYVDLGLLTADRDIGRDLTKVFNFFTGPSLDEEFRELLIAPVTMRREFTRCIRREAQHAQAGRPARIVAKVNGLEDPAIVAELYRASMAGVDIDLIVRDICRLRPGLEGISENVSVYSLVGRFLEHSRLFYFENGARADPSPEDDWGEPEYYIGSADWMTRNLDYRVEAVTPVTSPEIQRQLRFTLELALADNRKLWEMDSDGEYHQRYPADGERVISAQDILMREALKAGRSEDHAAGMPGDYPLSSNLCIAGESTGQTAAETPSESETETQGQSVAPSEDTANGDLSEVTDGGEIDGVLSKYSDRWYVPDSVVYDYAVRMPDGERRYLKTKAGVTDLLERAYSDTE